MRSVHHNDTKWREKLKLPSLNTAHQIMLLRSLLSSLPVLPFLFIFAVDGFKIDDSCQKAGIGVFALYSCCYIYVDPPADGDIRNALADVFEMVEAGFNALDPAYQMKEISVIEKEVEDRPDELTDLIRNVFAHDDLITNKTIWMAPLTTENYHMNLTNVKLRKVHGE